MGKGLSGLCAACYSFGSSLHSWACARASGVQWGPRLGKPNHSDCHSIPCGASLPSRGHREPWKDSSCSVKYHLRHFLWYLSQSYLGGFDPEHQGPWLPQSFLTGEKKTSRQAGSFKGQAALTVSRRKTRGPHFKNYMVSQFEKDLLSCGDTGKSGCPGPAGVEQSIDISCLRSPFKLNRTLFIQLGPKAQDHPAGPARRQPQNHRI